MFARCILPAAIVALVAAPLASADDKPAKSAPTIKLSVNGRFLDLDLVVTPAGDDDRDDEDDDQNEKEIPIAKLPDAVKAAIEKKFPKSKLLEAEVEVEGDKIVEYEVEIMTADGKKLELEVSKDGTKIEIEDDEDDDKDD